MFILSINLSSCEQIYVLVQDIASFILWLESLINKSRRKISREIDRYTDMVIQMLIEAFIDVQNDKASCSLLYK